MLRFSCDDGEDECGDDGGRETLHCKYGERRSYLSLCACLPDSFSLPCMPLPTALWWYSIYNVDSIVKCLPLWNSALGAPGGVSALVASSRWGTGVSYAQALPLLMERPPLRST